MRASTLTAAALGLGLALPAAGSAATFFADINPLNESGVNGTATLQHDEMANTLSVRINASGLVPDMLHPQHIHGRFESGFEGAPRNALVPPPRADDDGDGFIELLEGREFYGPIILPLNDPDGEAGFPVAEDGTIDFFETYDLSNSEIFAPVPGPGEGNYEAEDLFPLPLREIVLHGAFVPPGVQGTSEDAEGLVYSTLIPVAAGDIVPADDGQQPGVIPLPAAAWLLMGGLGVLGVVGRRRLG